ncbi:MAG: VTT domain-containing protein [Janthinobacterium lividum]
MTSPQPPHALPDSPQSPRMSSTAPSATPPPFFRPGSNCWRVAHADRFRMLVDGAAYFTALRQAIVNARQTVFILGWDIDSRMQLVPGGAHDGFPEPLAEFLHAIVARRPTLRIYVLSWDFAMLYAFEREWLPVFRMGWHAHRRFVFKQDGRHPLGGSHHQKVVLIDDRLAFVGGLDLTRSRWDTSEHAAQHPLRRDADGDAYAPFHDVQVMFDGAAAGAIGELVRERWLRANGRRVALRTARMRASAHDPWPQGCAVDIENVDLAICRTEPEYAGRAPVQEIRQMYMDAVHRARHAIFCENQYFTSGIVGAALLQRLSEPDGPEVAILSRRVEGGWLQEVTMGVLRARLHRSLRQTAHGAARYRMYCPEVPGLGDACVNVHSKVMVVDDDLLFVGSANLNNRSMVLDTECNVALDGAGDARIGAAIARMRDRLLAEHLGESVETVARQMAQSGSLIGTIETLRGGPRTLVPHDPVVAPDIDALVPGESVIDPETPMAAEKLIAQFVPETAHRASGTRFARLGVLALLIAVAAGVWHWTPLGRYLNVAALVQLTDRLSALPFSPLILIGAYMAGGLISMPITLLIAATGIAFGALEGSAYALAGTMASAALTYAAGRLLGRDTVRRLGGARLNGLSERLAERGLVAVVILRVLPVAPFTLVNVIAGASQIGLRDYLLGTLIGMGPGIVITVTFANRLVSTIRHPTWGAFLVLAGVGAALVGLSVPLQRFFRSRAPASRAARRQARP